MATPRSLGPLWYENCSYDLVSRRERPILQRGRGQEQTSPWRNGYCLILRLPLTARAVALGVWTGRQPVVYDEDGELMAFRRLDWG